MLGNDYKVDLITKVLGLLPKVDGKKKKIFKLKIFIFNPVKLFSIFLVLVKSV